MLGWCKFCDYPILVMHQDSIGMLIVHTQMVKLTDVEHRHDVHAPMGVEPNGSWIITKKTRLIQDGHPSITMNTYGGVDLVYPMQESWR